MLGRLTMKSRTAQRIYSGSIASSQAAMTHFKLGSHSNPLAVIQIMLIIVLTLRVLFIHHDARAALLSTFTRALQIC